MIKPQFGVWQNTSNLWECLQCNIQTGSPHLTHRKPIIDIQVVEETGYLLQITEQGAEQLTLNFQTPQGVKSEGSYRLKFEMRCVCVCV